MGCRDLTESFHKLRLAAGPALTHAVWLHGDAVADVREDADGVASVQSVDNSVALEVKAVDVRLRAQSRQVPGYTVPLAHGQARQVPVHIAIDRWNAETEMGKEEIRGNKCSGEGKIPPKKLLFRMCDAAHSAFCCFP